MTVFWWILGGIWLLCMASITTMPAWGGVEDTPDTAANDNPNEGFDHENIRLR